MHADTIEAQAKKGGQNPPVRKIVKTFVDRKQEKKINVV